MSRLRCVRSSLAAVHRAPKPVRITMWHQMGSNNGRVFTSIVDDFNRSQHDVQVKLVDQSAEVSALQTMIDSKATVPIQSCVDADRYSLDDFLPKVVGYYRVQGVLRSMPY